MGGGFLAGELVVSEVLNSGGVCVVLIYLVVWRRLIDQNTESWRGTPALRGGLVAVLTLVVV